MYQHFQMDSGTYMYPINVIVGNDFKKCAKFANFKHECTDYVIEDFDCKGCVFTRDGYAPILWMPRKPKTNEEYGTLNHEIFHIVYRVMSWAHIPLTESSEEAFCHQIKYLTQQFLNKCK